MRHPRNTGLVPDDALTPQFSVDTTVHRRKSPETAQEAQPPGTGCPPGSCPLTGAQAEACGPQLAAGQGPLVPEGELSTGLAQVRRPEAIVHHGVVEHGAEAPAHHPCPLAAGPAVVRQHGAVGEAAGLRGPPLTLPRTNLWLLPENWPPPSMP